MGSSESLSQTERALLLKAGVSEPFRTSSNGFQVIPGEAVVFQKDSGRSPASDV